MSQISNEEDVKAVQEAQQYMTAHNAQYAEDAEDVRDAKDVLSNNVFEGDDFVEKPKKLQDFTIFQQQLVSLVLVVDLKVALQQDLKLMKTALRIRRQMSVKLKKAWKTQMLLMQ